MVNLLDSRPQSSFHLVLLVSAFAPMMLAQALLAQGALEYTFVQTGGEGQPSGTLWVEGGDIIQSGYFDWFYTASFGSSIPYGTAFSSDVITGSLNHNAGATYYTAFRDVGGTSPQSVELDLTASGSPTEYAFGFWEVASVPEPSTAQL